MSEPLILLDDAAHGRVRIYEKPRGIICATTPEEVPAALGALQSVREMGLHTAGYFAYELGYVLEPKLAPRMPEKRDTPLIWFGVFDAPQKIDTRAIETFFEARCTGRAYAGPLKLRWSEEEYRSRFDRVRALIDAGDIYEANLTLMGDFTFVGDPLALYRSLRTHSAAPHGAYIDDGTRHILSLSPEMFLESNQDMITSRPMKGTAPRMQNAREDEMMRGALFNSAKDRAENLMIVDLIRNDLSRIAQGGSVSVSDLFAVESYPTVHQMVSTVSAQLKAGISVRELVQALFPCGSITGAPKIRAMEVLSDTEAGPRGIYTGAIGYFAPDGKCRFNVAIRTLTISGNLGQLGVGGAVVYDSDAQSEYAECGIKARFLTQHRQKLELIETLKYAPGEGFVRLNQHMNRIERSAAYFHLPFVRTQAADSLSDVVRHASSPMRVRLSLNEKGEFACTAAPLEPAPQVWSYVISPRRVASTDMFSRHKTSLRAMYDREFARLSNLSGCDEVLFLNEKNEVAEGRRSNVFVARGGKLLTPPLESGALDGCLRRELIEAGEAEEATLKQEDLQGEVYLGNSMRGLIRAVGVV